MYNIIDQSRSYLNMSILMNDTKSVATASKIDCVKECPCGVPAIPVPDQWLEVMVTGGFKVWHIIFIIIAFVVTIVVVYCCFHRCRIPRTKQEIEADLMRTNLATKFRDYLQEFPNEPTTFIEALKRVQELEEKSSEQDDATARKRKGWLKLKGKDRQEKTDGIKEGGQDAKENPPSEPLVPITPAARGDAVPVATAALDIDKKPADVIDERPPTKAEDSAEPPALAKFKKSSLAGKALELSPEGPLSVGGLADKTGVKLLEGKLNSVAVDKAAKPTPGIRDKSGKVKESKKLIKTKGEKVDDSAVQFEASGEHEAQTQPVKAKVKPRKRQDKPHLSQTRAAHISVHADSPENQNQLNLPPISSHHHLQQQPKPSHSRSAQKPVLSNETKERRHSKTRTALSNRSKTKEAKNSTVIQIETTQEM